MCAELPPAKFSYNLQLLLSRISAEKMCDIHKIIPQYQIKEVVDKLIN